MNEKKKQLDKLRILTEEPISLTQAAQTFPPTARPNVTTVWRWAKTGRKNIKLETIKIGAVMFTSRPALTRFLLATQDAE